jgi:hypothetical protein
MALHKPVVQRGALSRRSVARQTSGAAALMVIDKSSTDPARVF